MFCAYILKSLKDLRYYYGSTENIADRLSRHNKGLVKSTKSRRPLDLVYKEDYQTRSEAYKREMFFKSIDGYLWLLEKGVISKKE